MFFKKENSKNTETREEFHHLINNIYKKNTTVNIILKDKELEFYPQISGKKARLFSFITAFQNLTANPRYCSKTRKRNKRYRDQKEGNSEDLRWMTLFKSSYSLPKYG